jgi:NAD+-dependent protein deacetylase sirtuin 2
MLGHSSNHCLLALVVALSLSENVLLRPIPLFATLYRQSPPSNVKGASAHKCSRFTMTKLPPPVGRLASDNETAALVQDRRDPLSLTASQPASQAADGSRQTHEIQLNLQSTFLPMTGSSNSNNNSVSEFGDNKANVESPAAPRPDNDTATAAAAAVAISRTDDSPARRWQTLEALVEVFGFDKRAALKAIEAVGYEANDCCQFILDAQLGQDHGGPVTPIDSCPHASRDYIKVRLDELPSREMFGKCTFQAARADLLIDAVQSAKSDERCDMADAINSQSTQKSNVSRLKDDTTTEGDCPGGETWLCLTCGAVRCSRYVNGHGLAHWQATCNKSNNGHCVQVSLVDLSVWCHACQAYIVEKRVHESLTLTGSGEPILRPILQRLEEIKFDSDEPMPKRQKSVSDFNQATLDPQASDEYGDGMVDAAVDGNNGVKKGDTIQESPQQETSTISKLATQVSDVSMLGNSVTGDHDEDNKQSGSTKTNTEEKNSENEMKDDNKDARSESSSSVDNNSGREDEMGSMEGDDEAEDENEDDTDNDSEEVDDDEQGDERLYQIIVEAASARGIPIELLLQHAEMADGSDEVVEYPFEKLPTSLAELAEFIQSDKCRRVLILAGAGMSVASGIPDFRSADGLYATLNPDLLTASDEERRLMRMDPTIALDQTLFIENPLPMLELQREFILGTHRQQWKATLAHRFVELLQARTGKLVRLYTQNIDGLEDQCQKLPHDMVIPVHGSMDRAECALCHSEGDFDAFCESVQQQIKDLSGRDAQAPNESTPIVCNICGHPTMKPSIVLFKSSLPKIFFESVPKDVQDIDLFMVIGTSLRVAPANSLVWRVTRSSLRVLVNREEVGQHLGMDYEDGERDYFAEGDCDAVLLDLMEHLGWLDDLRYLTENNQLPESSLQLLRNKLSEFDGGKSD